MATHSVAVIGTGDPDEGAGIAYAHADAYAGLDDCELVACADIVRENAEAFAAEYGVAGVFEDYGTMLREVEPDLVSVCTPPAAHADPVIGAAHTGIPDAIHCEKPMADTWGAARRMVQECSRRGVQLTFNHQRRFGPEWQRAKERLDAGEIGDLRRVETGAPNLLDWGTHAVDLSHYFNDDTPAEWVMGQVDYREERIHFGIHHENQGLAMWEYANGVHGLASTGAGGDAVGALNRLVGTDGEIAVHVHDGPDLRVRRGGDVEDRDFEATWIDHMRGGMRDLLDALAAGSEPELSGRKALAATEVLFGAFESSRRRGRVDFPLRVEDHPLEAMVAAGAVGPGAHQG